MSPRPFPLERWRCPLSQLVACALDRGVFVAADRRVSVGEGPEPEVHALRKLYPLGPNAVLATSGAAVGLGISRFLSALFGNRPAFPLADLEGYALSVFQKEYDDFVRQGGEWFTAHPHAHRRSYVLLGGREAGGRFAFRFHASEAHGQPYRLLSTNRVLTAPRRLGLESRLSHALSKGASDGDIRTLITEGLHQIAGKEEDVSGPFDVALLDDRGLHLEEIGE